MGRLSCAPAGMAIVPIMNMIRLTIVKPVEDKDFENRRFTLGSMRNDLVAFNCYIKAQGL